MNVSQVFAQRTQTVVVEIIAREITVLGKRRRQDGHYHHRDKNEVHSIVMGETV
jgi:hypothetical protein